MDKVVILAGGKGARLRPFSFVIPKPLMPIGEDPILMHLIKSFQKHAINSFLISTGYQAELIKAYFGDGSKFGIDIKYFHEDEPLGTAGPLSLMKAEFLDDDQLFLINGDIYTELNFNNMKSQFEDNDCDILVGYVQKIQKNSFGVLNIENNHIINIVEKPDSTFLVSSGIYMLRGRVLKFIPDNTFYTMPDLINFYLNKNMKVGAYLVNEYWIGIENVENLEEVVTRLKLGL